MRSIKPCLRELVERLNGGGELLLLAAGIFMYSYAHSFFPNVRSLHNWLFNDSMSTAGASVFIVLALTPNWYSRLLLSAPIRFVGKYHRSEPLKKKKPLRRSDFFFYIL